MKFSFLNKLVRMAWAGVALPVIAAASTSAGMKPDDAVDAQACACSEQYSVINLGPDAGFTLLNRRGHAAFSSYMPEGVLNTFFDGKRLYDLGSLGGSFTQLSGLSNDGIAVGSSEDGSQPYSNFYAFTWTTSAGMRALPGPAQSGSHAYAVNDRRQVVGLVPAPSVTARANRWERDGSLTALGPLPLSLSEAFAINGNSISTGFADVANGELHAMVWDASGRQRDLGTLGGSLSFGQYINDNGQVAGFSAKDDTEAAFFWSPQTRMVQIGPPGFGARLLAGLNEHGEVAGTIDGDAGMIPYLWSIQRGLRPLPLAGASQGEVRSLNNERGMVGAVQRTPGDWRQLRAVLWRGLSNPIDLNTRLYRPPAGLVLYLGAAINDDGTILAHSNAGLVMLRPGRKGTAAPVLGPIVGGRWDDTVALNQTLDLSLGFVDSSTVETHGATASVNDGCPAAAPSLREIRGVGEVNLRHRFCQPGYYALKVRVKDSGGHATEVRRDLLVLDPAVPTLTGKGALPAAAAGAAAAQSSPDGVRFAVWAPLDQRLASGSRLAGARGTISLFGPFHFVGDITGQERAGGAIRLTGTGRLNGRTGYRFDVEASAGDRQSGSADRLRVRISHTDRATGAELVDYDNGVDAAGAARAGVTADRTRVSHGELRLTQ